jgi:hypothetical protein
MLIWCWRARGCQTRVSLVRKGEKKKIKKKKNKKKKNNKKNKKK